MGGISKRKRTDYAKLIQLGDKRGKNTVIETGLQIRVKNKASKVGFYNIQAIRVRCECGNESITIAGIFYKAVNSYNGCRSCVLQKYKHGLYDTFKLLVNKCGLYVIHNYSNGKYYIGSAVDIARRLGSHFSALEKGNHKNKELQLDYKPEHKFGCSLLLEGNPEDFRLLATIEQSLIYLNKNNDKCYNKHNLLESKIELTESQLQRFNSCIDKRDGVSCWNWTGNLDKDGYGIFNKRDNGITTRFPAHRVAYYICKGKIDDGLVIRHMCDNKLCCNPNHLRVGTNKENQEDRKIDIDKEIVISMLKDGKTFNEIGNKFKVSPSTIHSRTKEWGGRKLLLST